MVQSILPQDVMGRWVVSGLVVEYEEAGGSRGRAAGGARAAAPLRGCPGCQQSTGVRGEESEVRWVQEDRAGVTEVQHLLRGW